MTDIKPKMIHDIPDGLVLQMQDHLTPVFFKNNNAEAFIRLDLKDGDVKKQSFTWENDAPMEKIGLLPMAKCSTIMTFHTWAFHGFFKPTLYEVYCGIYLALEENWRKVTYFNLDIDPGPPCRNTMGPYHFCRCNLWSLKSLAISFEKANI